MEKKREITEEQVKEYQMLLAQWMQLPMDALEILNEAKPMAWEAALPAACCFSNSSKCNSNKECRYNKCQNLDWERY